MMARKPSTSFKQLSHGGDVRISITGDRRLIRKLDRMPAKVVKRVLRPAMSKGIQQIKKKLKSTAPKGDTSDPARDDDGDPRKRLKRAFKHQVKNRGNVIFARTGLGKGFSWAHVLHTGAEPHMIQSRRGRLLRLSDGTTVRAVRHPGFKANPFVTIALRTTGEAVRRAIIRRAWEGIKKEAKRR